MRQALTYKTFKAYMAYVKNRLKHAREKWEQNEVDMIIKRL
jgi:hypothetical protein